MYKSLKVDAYLLNTMYKSLKVDVNLLNTIGVIKEGFEKKNSLFHFYVYIDVYTLGIIHSNKLIYK